VLIARSLVWLLQLDSAGVAFHQNMWSGHVEEMQQMARAFRIARTDLWWGTAEANCGAYNFSCEGCEYASQ
jgi:hypothetical protein